MAAPKKPAPAPAPDLAALTAKYNVQPAATGSALNDPDDLPVYMGQTPFRMGKGPNVHTTSTLMKDFYAIKPEQLRDLQKRLWAGGFFPTGADPENVILGVHDELTYGAYEKLVERAASYYRAGEKYSPDDVLDMAAGVWDQINAAKGKKAGSGPGGAGGRERVPLTVELTDPTDIQAVAQRTAVATLGRALSEAEIQRFVASFQGQEHQAQAAQYAAGEAGGTSTQAPTTAAAAQEFARGAAPVEAGGNDFLRTYSAFSRLIARRGGA